MPCLNIVAVWARNFNNTNQFSKDSIESHSRDATVSQLKQYKQCIFLRQQASFTFWLVVTSVDWISKAISNKPFKTLHLERIKSKMQPTFKWVFGSKQQYQSRLQQDLVNLSLSNTFSIAKLNPISIKAKANSAKLIDTPTPHQSIMIHLNNGSSQFVVKHIFLLGSEGAYIACRVLVELDVILKVYERYAYQRSRQYPCHILKEQELHQDVKNTLSLISPLNNCCQSR